MNVLFAHQNFPGQFKHLAPHVAADPNNRVVALHINSAPRLPGVEMVSYSPERGTTPKIHPWVSDLETKVIRGEAACRAAKRLKQSGFNPDVIVAHPGWGESLFLKDVWPNAKLGIYCEYYYQAEGGDVNFDPEFSRGENDDPCRIRLKNAFYALQMAEVKAGLSPTHWQRSTFPEPFRNRISVVHDGIDTNSVRPDPNSTLQLKTRGGDDFTLTKNDEIITFVNRNLEPYRGYHIFMRALPKILQERPRARVLIVGGDDTSYGQKPEQSGVSKSKGKSWKQIFLDEVSPELDLSRVHFLGKLPYRQYLDLLQLSTVHVYLTYPFVLSWSLLEAMSTGCSIVASDTAPVREAVHHNETGRLVDFFDVDGLAENVIELCQKPDERLRLGAAARTFAVEHYDLSKICLPGQLRWLEDLAG
ncbi:glycosyltransferase family 4 protein [Deltaproteobacteria bacterium IMCC39524]|nr:glycosyltransferase family 4 protein [Deltaproteobacteria bacterium IMCC39524]